MSIDNATEIKYNQIVGTILQNIIAEKQMASKIVLWDFQEEQAMDRLYFNVAALYSDLYNENLYLNMPFLSYLRMKWKRRKTRKNLRWVTPWMASELPNKVKTSIYIIMDFVREFYDIPLETFEKINDEFYGWV